MKLPFSLFTILSFSAVGGCKPVQRNFSDVQTGIADIASKVTALDHAIVAFPSPGGSLLTPLICFSRRPISTIITNGVVDNAQGLQPAFVALGIGALPTLVYQDLNNLKYSTDGFTTALVNNVPPSLQAQAADIRDTALAYFDPAISAYAPAI
ncbi:hypothetical protein CVT24_007359 [Panaeolus cyanescens]|uniref:Uncharacterized protein n=1 Tax=Panaeolus cyanescens TaxID=181874 RepID=A0A409YL47_9AGAR|nr:hypothetical protein CVT24_007359 [Panaeolus cyanescens]